MYSAIRRISPVPMRDAQTGLVICDVFFFDVCGRLVVWDGNRAWNAESHAQSTVYTIVDEDDNRTKVEIRSTAYTLVDENGNRMNVDIRSTPTPIGDIGVAIAVLRTAAQQAVECALHPEELTVDDDAIVVRTDDGDIRLSRMASVYAADADPAVLDAETYVSTGDAARMLAISDDTVRRLIRRGELEAVSTQGGHYRILRKSIMQYAAGRNSYDS